MTGLKIHYSATPSCGAAQGGRTASTPDQVTCRRCLEMMLSPSRVQGVLTAGLSEYAGLHAHNSMVQRFRRLHRRLNPNRLREVDRHHPALSLRTIDRRKSWEIPLGDDGGDTGALTPLTRAIIRDYQSASWS